MQTQVIGAVEYRISSDEKDVITARYLSTGSMAKGAGIICEGRAEGDTSNGFPGAYVIRYRGVDGEINGVFDWEITPVGDGFRLLWRNRPETRTIPVEPGRVVFEGFGFPNSDRSIVVAYWMTEDASAQMVRAYQTRASA